jgi:hypothetical protein
MASWVRIGDKDRLTYNDEVWWLTATPGKRKPWLLYTERQHNGRPVRDKQQEIGAQAHEDAKHAAEVWLGLAKYCA